MRVLLLAVLVGVASGLGAVLFEVLSGFVVRGGLELVAGYRPTGPLHELRILDHPEPMFGGLVPWLVVSVVTVGGLLSGLLVFLVAPEAQGAGTDPVIRAYHRERAVIRWRVPIVKIIASAMTLGTGGSGGREGPIAQIGAGFGSVLAVRLRLSERERRLLLVAGLGAGIAALFRAPLAGAIFALEVLYGDESLETEALVPAFIACTVAYCVFGVLAQYAFGTASAFWHLFGISDRLEFSDPRLLGPLSALAVTMVAAASGYVRCLHSCRRWFARLPLPAYLRPAVGALLAGLVAVACYGALAGYGTPAQHAALNVLGLGYGILQQLLGGQVAPGEGLAVVLLAVGLGKILTTSLTIGSGGSAGVFGPSMVVGGSLGAVVGLLFARIMPGTVQHVEIFALLGMVAFFSAAANTPISTVIMASELTGGYELLLPSMWVAALAYVLSRGSSIFREQVPSPLDSPAHRADLVVDVLAGRTVRQVWQPAGRNCVQVPREMPLWRVAELLPSTSQEVFPVVDPAGRMCGLFSLAELRRFVFDEEAGRIAVAQDLAVTGIEPLYLDTDLSVAMGRFAATELPGLPVVDPEQPDRLLGILGRRDVVVAYRACLGEQRPQAGAAPSGP